MSQHKLFKLNDARDKLADAFRKDASRSHIVEGKEEWQKINNYYAGISDHVVETYEQMVTEIDGRECPYFGAHFASRFCPTRQSLSWDPSKFFPFNHNFLSYDDLLARLEAYNASPSIENYMLFLKQFKARIIVVSANSKSTSENSNKLVVDNFDFIKWKLRENEILSMPEHAEKTDLISDHFQILVNARKCLTNYINDIMFANEVSMYAVMMDKHLEYINLHEAELNQLFDNHFIFTDNGFIRKKDDLHKIWLDLMSTSFYFQSSDKSRLSNEYSHLQANLSVLDHDDPKYKRLIDHINEYHQIQKDKRENITDRIIILRKIAKYARQHNDDICKEISARALMKAQYLDQLRDINKEAEMRLFHLPKNKNGNAVVTCKEDELKDIDPAKRGNIDLYHEDWIEALDAGLTDVEFFMWLEVQNTSNLSFDSRHSLVAKDAKKIIFKDGKSYNALMKDDAAESQYIADGRYVYNIDEDGELYVFPAFETLNKFRLISDIFSQVFGLNHDTLLGGKNILCAGIVRFTNGEIVSIDTNSGHYRPLMIRHLRPALKTLSDKYPGSIKNETLIGDYNAEVVMTYKEFLTATAKECKELPLSIGLNKRR